jgi:alpha-tubulin suppressor-like RCC1 family protein
MRASSTRRALLAVLVAESVPFASVACNAILGVEDVKLRRARDGSPLEEDDVPNTDPPPDPDASSKRPNVFQTALGEAHTCARKPDGTVKCWGASDLGQTSHEAADGGIVTTPREVEGVADAVDIAAGRNHTCIARQSGTISCWGFNPAGQLGNGEAGNVRRSPVDVVGIRGVAVAAGGDFSCAIRTQGTVACWGGNDYGQLGKGDTVGSTTPVAVAGLTDVVAIAAGQKHACAVKGDGSVHCWGDGENGQLGYGMVGGKREPIAVESLPPAAMVAAGQRSTCALTRTGSVYCWGANEVGQLGTGAANATPNPSPIIVSNLDDAKSIWMGADHACALRETGAIVCWGAGGRGQLGDGKPRPDGGAQPSLVVVSGVQNAVNVGTGWYHSCAPTKTNAVLCWGANERGQLGNGSVTSELSPVAVSGYP